MDELYMGSVVIDVNDLQTMKSFWSQVLGYPIHHETDDWVLLHDPAERRPRVGLQQVREPRAGKNRLHLDLYAPDQSREVERIKGLGATHFFTPEEGDFVVLADPEGNLFCIIDASDFKPA